jgi:hypothetical protein
VSQRDELQQVGANAFCLRPICPPQPAGYISAQGAFAPVPPDFV